MLRPFRFLIASIKDPLSGLRQVLRIESPLIVMKNAFYFMLKALFVLEIFTFFLLYRNGLIGKLWLISQFMTSQTGQQIITIHIFPNISRSEGNQAMNYGELINYSKRNIFLQNHAEDKVGRLVLDNFLFFIKALQ